MEKSAIQETLASLYLRLNGYFVSGFIVHASHGVGTEMDVLAVRFPRHKEPEREVQPCRYLAVPTDHIDFVVGEVKGGPEGLKFNSAFRDDPQSIRSVLCRFGAFTDAQIDRVCATLPEMLQPAKLNRSAAFPELDVALWEQLGTQTAKLRFVLFATEQRRPSNNARPYIFEDDLLSFVWDCFRPEKQRMQCSVRYNFELWGPQFVQLVRYFKDLERTTPGTIQDIYQYCGI